MADAAGSPPPLANGQRVFVWLQYLLPQHALSRIVLRVTRSRWRWLKNLLIRLFVRGYRPDLGDATLTDPLAYASFNAFFTRELVPGARSFAGDSARICSPVDGTVSMAGAIEGTTLLQAKGRSYTLEALLAGDAALAQRYRGGRYATFYLAPWNYHRIHMPLDGVLRASWYVPGRLFSVNAATTACVPRLFARNERVICDFDAAHGPFAVVLVGALFVGSISTAWHGDVTPRRPRHPTLLPAAPETCRAAYRGDPLGCFNMGSTVILLLAPGSGEWHGQLAAGSSVRAGQPIGMRRAA